MGEHPKAFFITFVTMKKFWGIICTLLICNFVSLSISAGSEHKYALQQNTYCIWQQLPQTTLEKTSDFSLLEQPESVAVAVNNTNASESDTSIKNSSSGYGRFGQNNHRKYIGNSHISSSTHISALIGFSRAIDHYVYEFRHIII